MEAKLVRGESARQCRDRRGSLERKPKSLKGPLLVSDLLEELGCLKMQTTDFFVNERGLYSSGLNPKSPQDMACVTPDKIEEVWGKCNSFKTTNMMLNAESRSELLQLYSKIYRKTDVTNNEFMTWVVKGFIAGQMGFEVDWASAVAATAFLLASRLEGDLLKRKLLPEEASHLQRLAPHAVSRPSGSQSRTTGLCTTPSETEFWACRAKASTAYRMSGDLAHDIGDAEKVLRVEVKLVSNTESKEQFLESSKKLIADKIIGLKFSMEDWKSDAKEAADNATVVEVDLKLIDLNIEDFETKVQHFQDRLDEGNDGFAFGLQRLQELKLERDILARKFEFAKFNVEDSDRKAKKAQELYRDAGLDMWKSKADIEVVRREFKEVRRHSDAVANQIQRMKKGVGVACWPKPSLHPDVPEEVGANLQNNKDKVSFEKSKEDFSDTLKGRFGIPILEWSRGRQSDRGSSGSIYQVQASTPCISGGPTKVVVLEKGVCAQSSPPILGPAGEGIEVDSPKKHMTIEGQMAHGPDVDKATKVLPLDSILPLQSDQVRTGCIAEVAAEIEDVVGQEGYGFEAMAMQEHQDSPPKAEASKRYSFSQKRSLTVSPQDHTSRKKVGKSIEGNEKIDAGVGGKSRVPVQKKAGLHRHECRKGDVQAPIIAHGEEAVNKVST